ncbi:hypothetical protein [Streptomyces sp. NPDC052042]|uniref:hypothetical protein n=1 Tax=Streptomyces sp. NPDC052042 TaxID=3365683 RepID=UPI0037D9440F
MQFSPKVIATAVAAAVVVGAGVVGTAHASTAPTTPPAAVVVEKAATAGQDGRTLFAGLVFTQGRVADSLIAGGYYKSSKETLRKNRSAKAVAGVAELADIIEKDKPGFFAGLSTDLRSGDPGRVEAALDRTSGLLKEHVKVVGGMENSDTGLCAVLIVVANVAAAVNMVAVYDVEYAWEVQHFWMDQERPQLSAEESIARLTSLLKDA